MTGSHFSDKKHSPDSDFFGYHGLRYLSMIYWVRTRLLAVEAFDRFMQIQINKTVTEAFGEKSL